MNATPLLLFGGEHCERVALEALRSGRFEPLGFVDADAAGGTRLGLPVMTPEDAAARHPRESTSAFACGSERFLNQDRLALYMQAKRLGYRIASIASPDAVIAPGVRLRENVFVDAGARLLDGANLGANAWVLAGARLGARARAGASSWIGEGCALGDSASLGRNAVLAGGAALAAGVALPDWSSVSGALTLETTPAHTLFIDPLFRAPVLLRGAAREEAR